MPRKAKDITSETYGSLTAIKDTGKRTYGHVWLFQCACGKQHEAVKSEVTKSKGGIRSCGCAENSGRFNKTHGDTNSPTYVSWRSMLDRCYRESAENYPIYGGRGITVCPEWKDNYEQFKADMGERPDGMTIDRIDSDGMYEPSNCKWSTHVEQASNKRNTLYLTCNGETKTLMQWSEVTGLSYNVLICRHQAGWTPSEIIETPYYKNRKKELING